MRITKILLLCMVLLSASCGNIENEFSTIPCYLIIDNNLHKDATLASAMTAASPGGFCYIRQDMHGGAKYFVFKNNQGTESRKTFNAIDLRRSFILGGNNGLIVGFGNMDTPPVFYAYDNQCPNCFDPNAIPIRNYPLSMSTDGIATCNTCKRKYNMNTGGNIIEGENGKKLTRYRAATGGPYGVLSVN